MTSKFFRYLTFISAYIFLAFAPRGDRYFEISKNLEIFSSVYKEINNLYVKEINPHHLMRTAIDSMLSSLDPYTNYLSENEVENFRTSNTGKYAGIGALTKQIDNKFFVTMVYEDFPAFKSGLKIGDEIIKIDDVDISNMSNDDAVNLMHGQINTTVRLTVKRYGLDKPLDIDFSRQKVKVKVVPYSGMVSSIGYIRLTDFMDNASLEVENALNSLLATGAKGIILDLRNNPGGLVEEAVNICNLFIDKHLLVVSTRGKEAESGKNFITTQNPINTTIPLIVLINRESASASEIVAGTLQDYDRAVIAGEKSFGKGLVQLSTPLAYNSQIKITTAKYYTPSGRCIQVLDYSHRREDGSVGAVPDSIRKSFKTTRGRIVYDGGGIDPDLKIPQNRFNGITKTLIQKGCFLQYANMYVFKNQSIPPAKKFYITDGEYSDFVTFIKSQNIQFNTSSDSIFSEIVNISKLENDYADIKFLLDSLQVELSKNNGIDIILDKSQIKLQLEKEIVSRYFFEKGVIEVELENDIAIQKSIELLSNYSQYSKILHY